jgi:hypothetical protein
VNIIWILAFPPFSRALEFAGDEKIEFSIKSGIRLTLARKDDNLLRLVKKSMNLWKSRQWTGTVSPKNDSMVRA